MRKIRIAAILMAMALVLSTLLCGCTAQTELMSFESAPSAEYYAPMYDMAMDTEAEDVVEPDWNTEEYNYIKENAFKAVATSPLSTFSADVDTASYANLRRMINQGTVVDPGAVRIEEMLNYFYYDLPQPEGDEPFSVTYELSDCPWNEATKLLMIGLQAKKLAAEELPPSNLVFLVDVSGSMSSANKLPLVQQAFRMLTEQLKPDDRISIVTYASGDKVVLEGAAGSEGVEIMAAVDCLTAGGGTAGAQGIETAYKIAEENFIEGGNNRVILATDGDLNIGISSESQLTRLIEKKRESGVYLSVLGFGTGNIKDNKMEALADNGNGNYYYIDTVSEARKVLIEEMGGTLFTVAKDVKLQVAFNPAQIKGYRLIGYENRVMAAEDFNDDTKDAGEIGAGHRVIALYEIVDKDSDYEIAIPDAIYTQDGDTGSDELLTLSIRYKQPTATESLLLQYPMGSEIYRPEMSDNMTFAAAVAETGMLLRESRYSGTATYDSAAELIRSIDGIIDDEYKLDFLNLVNRLH